MVAHFIAGTAGVSRTSTDRVCEDLSVTGAIFYVMGFSEGRPLFNNDDTLAWVPEAQRVDLAYSFIDTLADLHVLDPDAIGLTALAKKEDYIGRQIKAWYRSWESSIPYAEMDDPEPTSSRIIF